MGNQDRERAVFTPLCFGFTLLHFETGLKILYHLVIQSEFKVKPFVTCLHPWVFFYTSLYSPDRDWLVFLCILELVEGISMIDVKWKPNLTLANHSRNGQHSEPIKTWSKSMNRPEHIQYRLLRRFFMWPLKHCRVPVYNCFYHYGFV